MFSLRRRRLWGDMTEVFNMIHGNDELNMGKLFWYRGGWKNEKTWFMFKN